MYDMYPEWGPAKHRRDDGAGHRGTETTRSGRSHSGARARTERRDEHGERPDDN